MPIRTDWLPAFFKEEMDLIKMRSQAEAYYRKKWKGRKDASDFGAFCVIEWLSGRSPNTSLKYLSIDYLRENGTCLGRNGSSDMLCRPKKQRVDFDSYEVEHQGKESGDIERLITRDLLTGDQFSERERIVLILYYEWRFTLKEIGDVFGVSESRAYQMHEEALGKFKEMR